MLKTSFHIGNAFVIKANRSEKFSTTGNWYMLSQIQHHFHEDFPELDYVGGLLEELVEESEYCPLSSGDVSGISLS